MSILSTDEQTRFQQATAGVRDQTVAHLGPSPDPTAPIHFVANLHRGVDQVFRSAIDRGTPVACAPGCSHCCSVRVHALEPEVFRIARTLSERGDAERLVLISHLQKFVAHAQGVSVQNHKITCAFLNDGLCSIYEVRPAVCRKCHSLDVRPCEDSAAEIPQDLNLVLSAEVLIRGTADGYRELKLPASSHELGKAVLVALTDASSERRWLAGEAVFDGLDPLVTS